MSERYSFHPEIPVWFEDRKKWVTGITKRTCVDDMIYALVRHSLSRPMEGKASSCSASLNTYRLTCVVNGQKSVLKGRTKIYKLWKSWKNSKAQVTLCIKNVPPQEAVTNQPISLIDRILGRKAKDVDDSLGSRANSLEMQHGGRTQGAMHECISTVVEQDKIILAQNEKLRLLNRGISEAEIALEKAGACDSMNGTVARLDEFNGLIQSIFRPTDSSELDLMAACIKRFFAIADQCAQQFASMSHATTPGDALSPLDASLREQVCASRELTRRQCKQIHDLELEVRDCDNALIRKRAEIRNVEQGLMVGALVNLTCSSPKNLECTADKDPQHDSKTPTNAHETDSGVTSMSSFDECNQSSSHIETLV